MSSTRAIALGFWSFLVRHRLPSIACALAGIWGWSGLIGFEPQLLDYLIVGAGVAAVYELNRITDHREDAVNCAGEARLAERHRTGVLLVSLGLGLGALGLALERTPRSPSLLIAGLLLLGVWYSIPIGARRPATRLKSIPVVKNAAAALGWATAVIVYPALNAPPLVRFRVAAAFLLMALGAFVVEVIWDLRDVDGDAQGGVTTLAHLLGVPGSRALLQALCLGAALALGAACLAARLSWSWSLVLINAAAFAVLLAVLPNRAWRWRPLSNIVVLVQAGLLVELGLLTRYL